MPIFARDCLPLPGRRRHSLQPCPPATASKRHPLGLWLPHMPCAAGGVGCCRMSPLQTTRALQGSLLCPPVLGCRLL